MTQDAKLPQVRINPDVREQFKSKCDQAGLTESAAIKMLINAVNEGKIKLIKSTAEQV